MSVSLQFEGAQFPTVSFRLSSKKRMPKVFSETGASASGTLAREDFYKEVWFLMSIDRTQKEMTGLTNDQAPEHIRKLENTLPQRAKDVFDWSDSKGHQMWFMTNVGTGADERGSESFAPMGLLIFACYEYCWFMSGERLAMGSTSQAQMRRLPHIAEIFKID